MSIDLLIIAIGFLLLVADLLLQLDEGFDIVLIGLNLIIGGLVARFVGVSFLGLPSWVIALGVAGLLSIAYVVFARSWIRRRLEVRDTKTNADRLIGQSGIVRIPMTSRTVGQVEINGERWRAKSAQDLKVEQGVRVVKYEGVTLWVEAV
jgi:membrane protein implicated in regulation of membrane protease activity